MKMKITKDFRFEASHSLPHLGPDHKCSRLHGHSYRFTVECTGVIDNRGFVIDYAEITQAVTPLLNKLDHHNLNEIMADDLNTLHGYSTAENLADYIYRHLERKLPTLTGIIVYETPTTSVVYRPCL